MFGITNVPVLFNITRRTIRYLMSSRFYGRKKEVQIMLVDRKGSKIPLKAEVGEFIYDAVVNEDISDYGICGGCLLCSTCHVVFKPEDFNKIEDPIEVDEEMMLKHTLDATSTSRLGCQVPVTESMNGIEISLPLRTRDEREIDLPDK